MMRSYLWLWWTVGSLLTQSASAPAAEPLLFDLKGVQTPAALISVAPDGAPQFRIGNEIKPALPSAFSHWGALPAMRSGSVSVLRDGSQISGDLRTGDNQTLRFETELFGDVAIPRVEVATVLLNAPFDYEARDRLIARLVENQRDGDWLLLDNGDELTGSIQRIEDDTVQLQSQVGPTPIAFQRVVALVFGVSASRDSVNQRQIIVGFSDGSWVVARRLAPDSTSADQIVVEAPAGWQFKAPLQDVTYLQSLSEAVSYLSQRSPSSYRHIPFLSLEWPYAVDRSVSGGLLRYGDQVFPTGIGMHSTARLTYELTPDDRSFQAELALDASAGTSGSVTYRVFVDNEQRFASPVVRGGDPPAPISVDVSGGRRLSLIVDFAERGDEMDRANWLNARLVR